MKEADILKWIAASIEPLEDYSISSKLYRCSVILNDGLELPCVVFRSRKKWVDLAIKRFKEFPNTNGNFLKRRINYRTIVETFVCSGNRINHYDIREIKESPYAIQKERMQEMQGETSMGWTQFTARMKDENEYEFGTTFLTEFFDMPNGYTAKDIIKIIPAVRGCSKDTKVIYREKPYFECFIDGL
ncbi:MAG: hypothetical protein K0S61_3746 [Anaerocolumna sp.]|jgi:hypothetical protein|nr:hypothetical protein [Anaerocolumna sp.]